MVPYLTRSPKILQWLHPEAIWKLRPNEKEVYFTFDDGPHPEITAWVVEQLNLYNAKATFFMVGEQALRFPGWPEKLRAMGHAVGHHSMRHVNGWNLSDEAYAADVREGAGTIGGTLFRPPYGRIKRSQVKLLKDHYHIVMWHVLTGDFDETAQPEECLRLTLKAVEPGSVVVLHDSEKAWPRLKAILPALLNELDAKGYVFKALPEQF